jgi:hypothetical protein
MDLQKVLSDHKVWLESNGEEGERADLRYADLRGADLCDTDLRRANLSYADLIYADLSYADLRYADLRGADLRDADLRRAYLSGAYLSGAYLRFADLRGAAFVEAKGFILLPVQDPRGYSWSHATLTEDGWKIRAGCHLFTIEESKAHWGEDYTGDREIGDMYLYAIEWLEKKLKKESE